MHCIIISEGVTLVDEWHFVSAQRDNNPTLVMSFMSVRIVFASNKYMLCKWKFLWAHANGHMRVGCTYVFALKKYMCLCKLTHAWTHRDCMIFSVYCFRMFSCVYWYNILREQCAIWKVKFIWQKLQTSCSFGPFCIGYNVCHLFNMFDI